MEVAKLFNLENLEVGGGTRIYMLALFVSQNWNSYSPEIWIKG